MSDNLPFDPSGLSFKTGEGPFHIRGVAFNTVLARANELPGGKPALLSTIGHEESAELIDSTIFLAAASYDIVPFIRLQLALSKLVRLPPSKVIRDGARLSAERDLVGLYRAQMRASSPGEMALRMPRMFERYFEPCKAIIIKSGNNHMDLRLSQLPSAIAGYYVWATEGFTEGAIQSTGPSQVTFTWSAFATGEPLHGVATSTVDCKVTW